MKGINIFRYTTAKLLPNDLYKQLNDFQAKRKIYPLNFSHVVPQKQISLFSKLITNRQVSKLFQQYLSLCEIQANPNEYLEPRLTKQVLFELKSKNTKIKLNKFNVCKTAQIFSTNIQGVFIHRDINLSKQCYSFEKDSKKGIKYRPKAKFLRSSNIGSLYNKKSFYQKNQYNLIYGDSFENFVNEEKIKLQIFLVDCQVEMEVKSYDQEPVCYGSNVTTRHYLQLQTVINPSQVNHPYLTDVDFILQGNNFFS